MSHLLRVEDLFFGLGDTVNKTAHLNWDMHLSHTHTDVNASQLNVRVITLPPPQASELSNSTDLFEKTK